MKYFSYIYKQCVSEVLSPRFPHVLFFFSSHESLSLFMATFFSFVVIWAQRISVGLCIGVWVRGYSQEPGHLTEAVVSPSASMVICIKRVAGPHEPLPLP